MNLRAQLSIIALVVLISGGAASTGEAQNFSSIPSYYTQLQYDLTSPSAYASAIGGYANPAVYGMMPGSELQFGFTDQKSGTATATEWGLFLGGSWIGFGSVRNEIPLAGGGAAGVNDMRLALSGGTRNSTLGVGFGWSSGDDEVVGRSDILQIGLVQRFGRYVSLGIVGDFALNNRNQSGLFDLAVRPLADERLTLFGDLELPHGSSLSNAPWSVGAMWAVVPGVQLVGRYFESESFALSMVVGFGRLGIAGSPNFDKDGDITNTNYIVRTGFPERNFIDTYAKKGKNYYSLNLHGNVTYRKFRFFDSKSRPLSGIIADLERAKADTRISGVAVNLSGAVMTRGKAWEIRNKLADVQASGKHVVIFVDYLNTTNLHLASVADRIVMDPEGMAILPGFVRSRTYVKAMLAKIGIGFDEWRFLKYKSAAEMFSRDSMSEADREQRLALLEDLYQTVRDDVTASRNIEATTFDEWINDQILFSAQTALDAGMVDKLGRWADVADVIEELEGDKKRYVSRSGIAANEFPSRLWGENPKVAIVYAIGECAMDTGIRARKLEKVFLKLRNDRSVDAVVFRVDSPGGDGMASDVAAAAMRKCAEKKPVIISQGDVAASGGYWLSMYGTKIYAMPMTITGSIGVIGGWVWNAGIGEKLGHTSDHVKVGDHADFMAGIRLFLGGPLIPDRNLTADEREQLMGWLDTFYNEFVDKVSAGRKMPSTKVESLAQGRVYSGVRAKDVGLVDEIGGLGDAIAAARAAAGIDPDRVVSVVEYPNVSMFKFDIGPAPFRALFGRMEVAEEMDFMETPEWTYLRMLIGSRGMPLYMLPPEYYAEEAQRRY